jgi:hypothetical protein
MAQALKSAEGWLTGRMACGVTTFSGVCSRLCDGSQVLMNDIGILKWKQFGADSMAEEG